MTSSAPHPTSRSPALAAFERSQRASGDDACERRLLLEQLLVWVDAFARTTAAGFLPARVTVVLSDVRVVRAALRARGHDPAEMSRRATSTKPDVGKTLLRRAEGLEVSIGAVARSTGWTGSPTTGDSGW